LANAPKVTKRSLPHHSVPRPARHARNQTRFRGPPRRPVPGPSRLNRHPCRFTRYTVPACGHRG
jgi:hypothetical protein